MGLPEPSINFQPAIQRFESDALGEYMFRLLQQLKIDLEPCKKWAKPASSGMRAWQRAALST